MSRLNVTPGVRVWVVVGAWFGPDERAVNHQTIYAPTAAEAEDTFMQDNMQAVIVAIISVP